MFYTIAWEKGTVSMIDQRRLPLEEHYVRCATSEEVARAIETMVIRGAPAIGVAAAMGVALGAREVEAASPEAFLGGLEKVIERLAATRPTAVNLFWALARMRAAAERAVAGGIEAARAELARESQAILDEDVAANRAMGRFGAELISDGESILTHCNAGALATGGYGTALGVLRAAHEAGKRIHVFVDETRPLLQGARLTAWELVQRGIPATLITDNMAGHAHGSRRTSSASSSGPIGSPPTATPPTRSARTAWPCWRASTASRSTSRRRSRPSTSTSAPTAAASRSRSARPTR